MSAAKKGLGRGLSALFGEIDKNNISNEAQKNKIPIADLDRNKYQPRTIFDEEKLNELSASIKYSLLPFVQASINQVSSRSLLVKGDGWPLKELV